MWSIVVNYLTHHGQILLRCYFLGTQGPCRLWSCGPAFRSSMVLGPAGTKAGRSVAADARLPLGLLCKMYSASHLPGAAAVRGVTGSVWWGERRELVQNWIVFKIVTV